MIRVNENYYAKDVIKQISLVKKIEENCVHYLQFSVYISLGDRIVREEIVRVDNNNGDGLTSINYIFNELLNNLTE